jgi:hypothetical protein
LIICLLISSVSYSFGQVDSVDLGSTVTVIGPGNRTIVTPTKISELPDVVENDQPKPLIKYTVVTKKIDVSFEPKPIAPANLKVAEPLEKLYAGYLKAGMGNYLMPKVDFYYGSTRSRKNNWGIRLNHFSAGQGPDDVGFSGFSENAAQFNYKHFLAHHTLKFDVDYSRDVNYFYGFDLTDSIFANFKDAKDEIKAIYNLIQFKSELESQYKDSSRVNHVVGLDYYHLKGNYSNRENQFVLDGSVQKYFGKELGKLDFELDYNDYSYQKFDAIDSNQIVSGLSVSNFNTLQNNVLFKLSPSINALRKNLKAKIGASLQVDSRLGTVHIFPDVEVKYSMFNNMFIPYIGITGDVKRNSYRSFSSENPFVSSAFELRNTAQRYEVYGGIRGSFSSSMSFNLTMSQAKYTDMPLYFSDTSISLQNKFGIIYDDANVLKIGGQLSYRKLEKLKMYVRGDYTSYKMENEAFAWHLPSIKLSVGGVYDIADKLIVKADLYFIGNRKAKSLVPVTGVDPVEVLEESVVTSTYYPVEMKAIFDANLGVEYRLTEKVSAFCNVNNLTTKKYQEWLRYPTQSINVMFGGTIRF